MATQTTNYNMTKPDSSDLINVGVLNENMDIIDKQMKKNEEMASAAVTTTPSRAVVNLTTTWSGSGPYTQAVMISGAQITSSSKVDLQPDATTLAALISAGVTALYIANNNGTLTAYAVGAKPTTALSIQCTISNTNTFVGSLSVTTQPTKTSYVVGNPLDLTGAVVTATFGDGSTAVVTDDCTFDPADGETLTSEGTQTVEVSYLYNGVTSNAELFVTVAKGIDKIEVTTMPTKTVYDYEDELDLTGIVVTATYTDGTSDVVTSGCIFNPADGDTLSKTGTQEVLVSYTENDVTKTTTFDITVSSSELSSIAVTTQPTTTTYTQGDTLDLEGLVVTATYENEDTEDVTSGCVFSPDDGDTLSTVGTQTVSIAYSEGGITKVTSFNVTVVASE